MADINLVPAIRTIEEEIRQITARHRKEIEPYEESLKQLKKINTACLKCGGKGKILRGRSCAEDDRPDPRDPNDWETCVECHGTGKESKGFGF